MTDSKLNFGFFCDHTFFTDDGKPAAIGIFERIFTKTFPYTHPVMWLVANFTTPIPGEYRVVVDLQNSSGNSILKSPLKFNLNADIGAANLGIVGRFLQTTFTEGGVYHFHITVNDKSIGDINLPVRSA